MCQSHSQDSQSTEADFAVEPFLEAGLPSKPNGGNGSSGVSPEPQTTPFATIKRKPTFLAQALEPDVFIQQDWNAYTAEQHDVWHTLFERRMKQLNVVASRTFLDGLIQAGIGAHRVPDFRVVNRRLRQLTGWRIVPVNGFLKGETFFACLAERRFPCTVTIRSRQDLDYTPAPDIFHDVFGHVPLCSDPVYANFLQRFGEIGAAAPDAVTAKRLATLFWFTVEFGIIRENDRLRVYGSGLISSQADCANALGPQCNRRPLDLEATMNQPYDFDRIQDVLFVTESYAQLYGTMERAAEMLLPELVVA